MPRNETLRFLHLAHFFDHFFLLIFPTAAIVIASDWDMTYGAALALGTPILFLFALGTLPAGLLGDRFDKPSLIVLLFLGCGVSSLGVAFSAGPTSLMTGLGFLGLFAALYHPIGLPLVTESTPRSGRALAINGVFGNLGLAGAATVTGLLADMIGWRSAFLVPGLVSIAIGCLMWLRLSRTQTNRHRILAEQVVTPVVISRKIQGIVFTIVCISALFGGLVFNTITISLPKVFAERLTALSGDLTLVGAYTGLVFTIAAFAQLPVGELLDRIGARKIMLILLPAQIGLLLCLTSLTGWLVVPITLLLIISIFAEIPVTTWLIGHYIPSHLRSRAVSLEYVLSLGIGAAILPILAAMHNVGLGFDFQFYGLSVSVTIVLMAAWFLPAFSATIPKAAEQTTPDVAPQSVQTKPRPFKAERT